MTLNDILVAALAQLDRGHDAQTLDIFRDRLTCYANDAQSDLARALRLTRTEDIRPSNGIVELSELSRDCLKVVRAEQLGHEVRFIQGSSGEIALPYNELAKITYRFEPKPLSSPTDVSELPEHVHGLIVSYVVGRERMSGDVSTQKGSNMYLSMYEAAKAKLRPGVGAHESYELRNRY